MIDLSADQMERIHLMSMDDCGEVWDLSANDCTALRALLDSHDRMTQALSDLLDTVEAGDNDDAFVRAAQEALANAKKGYR